jgi:hypothetical protein
VISDGTKKESKDMDTYRSGAEHGIDINAHQSVADSDIDMLNGSKLSNKSLGSRVFSPHILVEK